MTSGAETVLPRSERIPFVSLFSGGLGLDIGLEQAGFRPLVANDVDQASIDTIRANKPDLPIIADSITQINAAYLSEAVGMDLHGVPLVAGGPPCQPFSVFGRRKGVADKRGGLIFEFVRLVSELRPQVFLMENVRGLHSMPMVPKNRAKNGVTREATENGSLLREVLRRFETEGYRVDCFLVNAVNYGAPQNRERLICIGNRFDLTCEFPEPTRSNRPEDGLPPFSTLGEAIGGPFDDPDSTLMNFSERKLRYLSMVPPGGNWRGLPAEIQKESMGKSWYLKGGRSAYWRKLSFDFPSPTVVTMPNHAGTSMCHPEELRALTVGECASIQEFPRTWRFYGRPADKYRLVGNAVPVRLAKLAGETVFELLTQIRQLDGKPTALPLSPSRIEHVRPHVRTRAFWKGGKAYAGSVGYYDSDTARGERVA